MFIFLTVPLRENLRVEAGVYARPSRHLLNGTLAHEVGGGFSLRNAVRITNPLRLRQRTGRARRLRRAIGHLPYGALAPEVGGRFSVRIKPQSESFIAMDGPSGHP